MFRFLYVQWLKKRNVSFVETMGRVNEDGLLVGPTQMWSLQISDVENVDL
jgi:hypothetical protein